MAVTKQTRKALRGRSLEDPEFRNEVKMVRAVCEAFEKAQKGAQLYPKGSKVLRGYLDDFLTWMRRFLQQNSSLPLSVFCEEISYYEEVVYNGGRNERNLAVLLFDGGIKEMVFTDGIELSELETVIECINKAFESEQDHVLSLLWERNLEHVSYVTVDFFEDDSEWSKDFLEEAIKRSTIVDRIRDMHLQLNAIAGVRQTKNVATDKDAQEVFDLSPQDLERLHERLKAQSVDSTAEATIDLLLYLLGTATEKEAVKRHFEALESAFRMIMEAGNIDKATITLTRVREMTRLGAGASREAVDGAHAFLEKMSAEEFIKTLAKRLKLARDPRPILGYLKALGKFSLQTAPSLLGESPHDPAIVASISRACAGESTYLKQYILDPRRDVARIALRALVDNAGASAVGEYIKAAEHTETAVRAEAYVALCRIATQSSLLRAVDGIDDKDLTVRKRTFEALLRFVTTPQPELYAKLERMMADKTFATRGDIEKQAMYSLMAVFDPEKGVAELKKILLQKGLLRKKVIDAQKIVVVRALERVLTAESENLLQQTQATATDELRAACMESLTKLRKARKMQLDRERLKRTAAESKQEEKPKMKPGGLFRRKGRETGASAPPPA